MDAAETRIAEINATLQKRGADQIRGTDRTALVNELAGLLGASEEAPSLPASETQARTDEITCRLQDHALGKPGGYLDVFERTRLRDELVRLSGAGEADTSPAGTGDSGDGAA